MDRNLRNPAAVKHDFAPFNHCFRYPESRIKPSDIDMHVERNGFHLIGEWKVPGEELTTGARIALHSLSLKPKCTVFVVWADKQTDESQVRVRSLAVFNGARNPKRFECSNDEFSDFLSGWYDEAEANGKAP